MKRNIAHLVSAALLSLLAATGLFAQGAKVTEVKATLPANLLTITGRAPWTSRFRA